jgi:predicted  nucleic acid-binding Zn-ribbon protein
LELDDVKRLRDNALREVGELKGSLHVAEEHKSRLQREIAEAQRKIKDGKNYQDPLPHICNITV